MDSMEKRNNIKSIAAEGQILTVKEAAVYLKRSERWIREAVARDPQEAGSIPHHRLPGRRGGVRFDRDELLLWLKADCPPAAVWNSWQNTGKINSKTDYILVGIMFIVNAMKDFPKKVKQKRKKLGMSQRQLAESLNTHVQTISRWERGEHLPHAAHTIAILALIDTLKPPSEKRFNLGGGPKKKKPGRRSRGNK